MTIHTNLNDTMINSEISQILRMKRTAAESRSSDLKAYITLGEELSALGADFPSTKVRGQEIRKRFPATADMDPALRSNCKWLYEALNKPNHEAHDILGVLGVTSIDELRSGCPTVIRREYSKAKTNLIP